jgi:hypothetical protein
LAFIGIDICRLEQFFAHKMLDPSAKGKLKLLLSKNVTLFWMLGKYKLLRVVLHQLLSLIA